LPALPWESFAVAQGDREYRAVLSYCRSTSGALPRFFGYASRIRRQLADYEGLVGYSLDAYLLAGAYLWSSDRHPSPGAPGSTLAPRRRPEARP
jgi:hypothetical protein